MIAVKTTLLTTRTLESFHEKRRRMNQKKRVVLKGGEKSFQKRGDGNLKETPQTGNFIFMKACL